MISAIILTSLKANTAMVRVVMTRSSEVSLHTKSYGEVTATTRSGLSTLVRPTTTAMTTCGEETATTSFTEATVRTFFMETLEKENTLTKAEMTLSTLVSAERIASPMEVVVTTKSTLKERVDLKLKERWETTRFSEVLSTIGSTAMTLQLASSSLASSAHSITQ